MGEPRETYLLECEALSTLHGRFAVGEQAAFCCELNGEMPDVEEPNLDLEPDIVERDAK